MIGKAKCRGNSISQGWLYIGCEVSSCKTASPPIKITNKIPKEPKNPFFRPKIKWVFGFLGFSCYFGFLGFLGFWVFVLVKFYSKC